MSTRLIFGFFFLAGLAFIAPAHATAHVLKVLQFNFNSELVLEDHDYRFRDRRFDAMVEWIEKNAPDVVFLQEGWNYHHSRSVIQALGLATGYDYAYRVGEGIPFLYADSDGLLVKKSLHFFDRSSSELPHGGPEIGSGRGWVLPLGANSYGVGGKITLEDGSFVYLYSTHLVSVGKFANQDDLKAIHRLILSRAQADGVAQDQIQAIIAGDFNSIPTDFAPLTLTNLGYHDTFAESHPGLSTASASCTSCSDSTTEYFNPMTVAPGLIPKQAKLGTNDRIDYVFAKGPLVTSLASTIIFNEPIENQWMSDHFGVLSTIAFGGVPASGQDYPNPLREEVHPDTFSLNLHLSRESFSQANPDHILQAVSASRGVTFVNDSPWRLKINWTGSGLVWASNHVKLKKHEASAFYFDPNETYRFTIKCLGTKRQISGWVKSSLK